MKHLFVVLTALQCFLISGYLTGMSVSGKDSSYCPGDPMMLLLNQRRQIESALILPENSSNLIPLHNLDTLKIASLSVGRSVISPFQQMLGNYTSMDHFFTPADLSGMSVSNLQRMLKGYNLIIAGFYYETHEGEKTDSLWDYLTEQKTSVVVCFHDKKNVTCQETARKPAALIWACHDDEITQELAAQLVFGGIGKDQPIRLKYTIPEETGLSTMRLTGRIDSIVNQALSLQAFPGCNILIAKEGKVIFQKAYGYHTFSKRVMTDKNDLYDLASVTKVTGALPALMKLYDQGKLNLDASFSTYWPDWKKSLFHRSDKEGITVRELLAHQAGLTPYIGFYKETMKNGALSPKWYRVDADEKYNLTVAPGLYLHKKFKKKVYKSIRLSALKDNGKYVYSDLFFVLAPEGIAAISGMNYIDFLDSIYYRPLGAGTLTYNPWQKFPVDRIVPTENDNYYRKRQLQGSVHDESAAVLGGISGNAGLFGNSNDLAKLLQMYVQLGTYGGNQYLKDSTVREFTRVQYPENNNRRGAGFDKPLYGNNSLSLKDAYPAPGASPESFGHSGYTGTFFWVDPIHQLVFIFLSNRVYPSRNNSLLSDLNIRTRIQQVIYEEILHKLP